MEIELQRKLGAMIRADKDITNVIKTLDEFPTEINLVDGTPLNHAINRGRNEIVKYLVERGANVNALYEGHYSPLMSAVGNNNVEMVKLLLENGADVNLKDKYGNRALWKAILNYNLQIVKLLVEAGADPFKADNPENYSNYDGAVDLMPATEGIVKYFDSLK
ncbi:MULTISPECIES: ankyrin repeat domain-containing protein [unclassified Chryseobacterium]|jgi:ankyrin repeat protein|uniref:ankyrin repeat domain-containing protein n=1 Tax=unclassified Chryseobacterium TaxID=2593645 RepID=UPI001C5B958A|nr:MULTISPECIES: ankyrin repeat domain-containing protein [unclassified Chryseobacterium]MBW3521211.1 ankyrin repeat domain-containing protein [Chryseobacterium sp. NKUCC03_KSP]MCD0456831.1 ankyrin repeat domain-containing protein [Chryseobacterium sp. LC2016-27]